jgi:hypothetical protein
MPGNIALKANQNIIKLVRMPRSIGEPVWRMRE